MAAMTASHGARAGGHRRADHRRLPLPRRARGRLLRAGVGRQRRRRCCAHGADGGRDASSACFTGHGLKDPQTALGVRRLGRAVRAGHRRRRAGRPRLTVPTSASRPRRPTWGRASTCSPPRSACGRARGDRDGAVRGPHRPGDRPRRAATSACAAFAALRPPTACGSRSARTCRCPAASGRARPPTWRASRRPTRSSSGGARPAGAGPALEGHPDNVAAALMGGVRGVRGRLATRLDPPSGLEAVLVVPREAVRTAKARAALPAEVPMSDAVFNVGARLAARARARPRRPRPRRARARRPPAPAAARARCTRGRWSWSSARCARRARRHDLRRRADRSGLDAVRGRRGR